MGTGELETSVNGCLRPSPRKLVWSHFAGTDLCWPLFLKDE